MLAYVVASIAVLVAARLAWGLLRPGLAGPARTLVVLGSGGHTAEMLRLLGKLDPETYSPRIYVVAATDTMSGQKARSFEEARAARGGGASGAPGEGATGTAPQAASGTAGAAAATGAPEAARGYRVETIPRSREVGQSFTSSVPSTLQALAACAGVALRALPDVVLVNGPGTCVPVVASVLAARALGLCRGRIVYVESIARVYRLSLSGKIIYKLRLSDAFFVQWPELKGSFPRATYAGRLM